jgi:type VI secretion system ImpM family protein
MTGWQARAGVFGKAPWHPEFLRPSPLTSELHGFDEWLFRNAAVCSQPGPEGAAGPAASYGFFVRLEGAGPLHGIAGALQPSRDAAGRAYPLAVGAPVEFGADVGAHGELLPLVLEEYWDAAVDALAAASGAAPDARDLERLTERPVDCDPEEWEAYFDWIGRTDASELCESFAWPMPRMQGAIQTVGAVALVRATAPPSAVAEAFRVPLGTSAGGGLCFWLDAIRRATGVRSELTSFFWAFDGQAGDALVFLGAPGDAALATLWRSDGDARLRVCDLTLASDDLAGLSLEPNAGGPGEYTLAALLEQLAPRASTRA